MGELLEFAASASEKIGVPPEILTGFPVIELTGDCAIMVEQHHGILSYSDQEVIVSTNIGLVHVCGIGLAIRVMNRQKIILYGQIASIHFERNLA